MDLIKTSGHLFLFEMVEQGLEHGNLADSDLARFREEGVSMTLSFAEKYFNKYYEAYLQLSLKIIVGITNYGVIRKFAGNQMLGSSGLKTNGLVYFFREGLTAINKLLTTSNHLDEFRDTDYEYKLLDLCEKMAWERNAPWQGLEWFNAEWKKAQDEESLRQFYKAFIGSACTTNNYHEKERLAITKIYSSLLAGGLKNTLSVQELAMLGEKFALLNKFELLIVFERASASYSPSQYAKQKILDLAMDLIDRLQGENKSEVMMSELEVSDDVNEIMGIKLQIFRDADRADVFDKLANLEIGEGDSLEYVKIALERFNPSFVELIILFTAVSDYKVFAGKIEWSKFSNQQVIEMFELGHNQQILDEMLVDWASFHHSRRKKKTWGRSLEPGILLQIARSDPETIRRLSCLLGISYQQLKEVDEIKNLPYLLTGNADIFDFYQSCQGENSKLFRICRSVNAQAGKKAIELSVEKRAAAIRRRLKMETTQSVFKEYEAELQQAIKFSERR